MKKMVDEGMAFLITFIFLVMALMAVKLLISVL